MYDVKLTYPVGTSVKYSLLDMPCEWNLVQIKSIVKPMESIIPSGDYFDYIDIDAINNTSQTIDNVKTLAVSAAPSRARRKVHSGDTVFSLVRPYLKNVAYIDSTHSHCIASTGFHVCSPNDSADSRYLFFLLCSDYVTKGITAFMKGDKSPAVRKTDFNNFVVPLPPLPEQRRIAAYLDNRVSKIDRLVSMLSRRLSLLDEYKKSLISETVTHGLEPNRAMKDSGIEWIGEIPAEWDVMKLAELVELRIGKTPPRNDSSYWIDGDIPWFSIADMNDGQVIMSSKEKINEHAMKTCFRSGILPAGTLIMSFKLTIGKVSILGCDAVYNEAIAGIIPKADNITKRYLFYALPCFAKMDVPTEAVKGNTLNSKKLNAMRMIVPPLAEQRHIASYLDAKTSKLDSLMSACKKQIELLNEYKASLISECVTGKRRISEDDVAAIE